jgi:hypothetical protein
LHVLSKVALHAQLTWSAYSGTGSAAALALTTAVHPAGLQLPGADQKKVKGIQEFCSKPDFKSRSCGWASAAEEDLTGMCLK